MFLSNYKNRSRFVENLIYYLESRHQLSVFRAPEDSEFLIVQTVTDIVNTVSKRVVVVGTDVDFGLLVIVLTLDGKSVDMLKPKILKRNNFLRKHYDEKI